MNGVTHCANNPVVRNSSSITVADSTPYRYESFLSTLYTGAVTGGRALQESQNTAHLVQIIVVSSYTKPPQRQHAYRASVHENLQLIKYRVL